jgi:4-amino-4-deoxy-L-arabinose transferase-like glycosyltransferase
MMRDRDYAMKTGLEDKSVESTSDQLHREEQRDRVREDRRHFDLPDLPELLGPMTTRHWTRWLVLIVVIGFVLRAYQIGEWSFWIDEIFSVERAFLPITQIPTSSQGIFPPLYYVLLHYWVALFGSSELAVRGLSLVFGVAAIPGMYLLGKELFDTRAGLIAALLMSLSTYQIHYSRIAKMYALFISMAVLSLYSFVRLMRTASNRVAAVYVLSTILLLFSHAFAVFVVLAQNVYVLTLYLFDDSGLDKPAISLKRWFSIQLAVGLLFSPWLLRYAQTVLGITGSGAGSAGVGWLTLPTLSDIGATLLRYAGLPSHYPILADGGLSTELAYLVIAAFMLCFAVLLLGVDRRTDKTGLRIEYSNEVHLLLTFLAVMMGVPFVLSYLISPMYHFRYVIAGSIAFYLMIAGGVASISTRNARVAVVLVLVLSSVAMVGAYHSESTVEDWQGAVQWIESNSAPDDLVVVNPYWAPDGYEYYADRSGLTVVQYGNDDPPEDRRQLRRRASGHDQIWLLAYNRPPGPITNSLNSYSVTGRKQFGWIDVYRLEHSSSSRSDRYRAIFDSGR